MRYGRFCTQTSKRIGDLTDSKLILCYWGSIPLSPPVRWGLRLPDPTGDSTSWPRLLLDWIPQANWILVWRISVSESGSQSVQDPNSRGIFSIKLIISHKLKITQLSRLHINPFQNIAHLLRQKEIGHFYTQNSEKKKTKYRESRYPFQHIAHLSCKYVHF